MALINQKKGFTPPVMPANVSAGSPVEQQQLSLIGRTLLVKGEVISDDEVIIEGKIEGKVTVKNRVVIGKNGLVHADIEAREVVIKGKVYGNIKASFRVEIVPEGALYGNIFATKVVIADGAFFEGNIDMKAAESKTDLVTNQKKEAESILKDGNQLNTTPYKK